MADITSNLLARWKLDETSGTSAADSSGNAYNGTYSRAASNTTTSGPGGAITLGYLQNGTSDKISVPSGAYNLDPTTGNYSFSMWIKTAGTPATAYAGQFTGNGTKGFSLAQRTGTILGLNAYNSTQIAVNHIAYEGSGDNGKWIHAAFVWTQGSSTMTAYKNTVTGSGGGSLSLRPLAAGVIGGSDNGQSSLAWADFRIYTRALAADDVAALFDLGKPQNTVAPGITGDCIVGQTITGTSGTWSDGSVNARKWQSATDGSGTGVADIGGATSAEFTITESELAKYVRYAVQYSNGIGTTWAYSSWMGPIEAPPSLYRPRCPSFSLSLPTLSLG